MFKLAHYFTVITFRLAQIAILGTLCIVTYEVIARYLFHSPTQSSLELTEYLMVAMGVLPMAAIYANKGHVSVDLVTNLMSPKWQHVCHAITLIISFLFGAIVFWFGAEMTIHAFETKTASSSLLSFPMWIAYSVIPLGFLAFSLESLNQFINFTIENKEAS
jgi:C4-dicarboxylate transporter DctQ subunit